MSNCIVSSWLNILNGATAVNSAPTLSTDGVAVPVNRRGGVALVRLRQSTTTGTDARSGHIKLWGYCAGEVDSDGASVSNSSGWDDLGVSHTFNTSSNGSVTAEATASLASYSRIYAEVLNIAGSGTAISVAIGFTDEE